MAAVHSTTIPCEPNTAQRKHFVFRLFAFHFMFEADLGAKVVHLQNSYNRIPCNDLPLGQSQTYPGKYWKGKIYFRDREIILALYII